MRPFSPSITSNSLRSHSVASERFASDWAPSPTAHLETPQPFHNEGPSRRNNHMGLLNEPYTPFETRFSSVVESVERIEPSNRTSVSASPEISNNNNITNSQANDVELDGNARKTRGKYSYASKNDKTQCLRIAYKKKDVYPGRKQNGITAFWNDVINVYNRTANTNLNAHSIKNRLEKEVDKYINRLKTKVTEKEEEDTQWLQALEKWAEHEMYMIDSFEEKARKRQNKQQEQEEALKQRDNFKKRKRDKGVDLAHINLLETGLEDYPEEFPHDNPRSPSASEEALNSISSEVESTTSFTQIGRSRKQRGPTKNEVAGVERQLLAGIATLTEQSKRNNELKEEKINAQLAYQNEDLALRRAQSINSNEAIQLLRGDVNELKIGLTGLKEDFSSIRSDISLLISKLS